MLVVTRCVTFNTDHNLNIQARVTWGVACIRACSLICFFLLCANTRTRMINTDSLIDVIAFQTECTGLDLLTTVLCAVNAKAARIRKNHQEQSQVGEGEGTFYASITST